MSVARHIALLVALTVACVAGACGGGGGVAQTSGPAWFEEVAEKAGLDFRHTPGRERAYRFPEIVGSGLGFADVDEDGFLDLFAVQSGELSGADESAPSDRLYRNRRDGTFEDVTTAAGLVERAYGMGCAFGDADGDGHVDLFVTNVGPDVLHHNLGQGRFEDVTARAGVGDPNWGTSAAFLDYDADGDLDLFVCNYVNWSSEREIQCSSSSGQRDYCSPKNYNAPAPDSLFRNEGALVFTDVSEKAGIHAASGNGLGVVCQDFDQDGRLDLYVANDLTPNQLWMNQGDGTFQDEALFAGCAVNADGKAEAGMGVIAFDHQEDGDTDFFITHLDGETNTLFQNDGGLYSDQTRLSGLGPPSFPFTGWGTGDADFDHDGWLDIYVANGRVARSIVEGADPFAEPDQLFRGLAGTRFEEVLPRGGVVPSLIDNGRGAAFGDYDNDGDVDVAVSNNGGRLHLLRNVAARGHWIQLRVLDARGSDALGASLSIQSGTRRFARTVRVAYSFCSSNDPRVHLGLGASAEPVTVSVRWLDSTQQSFGPLAVDRQHVLSKSTTR
ncbi:MAG: CRTAC1 family protein [Planctomycetes bacterium]|nr:CRTAC1 family protein [Planctomycetota bacterium]